jgi:exosortase D (VPLPA-CTERM-specific)
MFSVVFLLFLFYYMNLSQIKTKKDLWKVFFIAAALLFLFATTLVKLGRDWWTDENYSHGLLVPFVIGYIIWLEFDNLRNTQKKPQPQFGFAIVLFSLVMLLGGTLGAELFTQRISFVLVLAGIVVYFFGAPILQKLVVPFVLLLLAIPIPQIIFNKIAFPLQIWASQAAAWGISLFEIPVVRNGNVLKLVPRGATKVVGLEVVEACSGIRSLMTLVTLALILSYFTKDRRRKIANSRLFDFVKDFDFWRTVILMISAIPIAILTNSARVTSTGVLTYYYGEQMAVGFWHEFSGWLVFVAGFVLLVLANFALNKFDRRESEALREMDQEWSTVNQPSAIRNQKIVVLLMTLLIGGLFINWFERRGELPIEHLSLHELPVELGAWQKKGEDTRFSAESESVLRASDYVMRNYFLPSGRRGNLYIGYYASQRSGATYHSPLNCLPGSGWEMHSPELVEIKTPAGKTLLVNRYIVQNGNYRAFLIYWYQGRGRVLASEYQDKFYTVLDSVLKRRSDGAMVRVMTAVGENEAESRQAAIDLASQVADQITPFVPD